MPLIQRRWTSVAAAPSSYHPLAAGSDATPLGEDVRGARDHQLWQWGETCMGKKAAALANPALLDAVDQDERDLLNVVVETVKGSRNKVAFDADVRIFRLKRVLPEGMSFPYDFGFVPGSRGEDGDPLDVLLLMDEPAFPGCLVPARLLGVIEGEQTEGRKKFRNDRLIAVAADNHTHSDIRDISHLNTKMLEEIEAFFTNYHALSGTRFKALGRKGPKPAWKLVKAAVRKRKA
jgi:inorganic pyrophosphatase